MGRKRQRLMYRSDGYVYLQGPPATLLRWLRRLGCFRAVAAVMAFAIPLGLFKIAAASLTALFLVLRFGLWFVRPRHVRCAECKRNEPVEGTDARILLPNGWSVVERMDPRVGEVHARGFFCHGCNPPDSDRSPAYFDQFDSVGRA